MPIIFAADAQQPIMIEDLEFKQLLQHHNHYFTRNEHQTYICTISPSNTSGKFFHNFVHAAKSSNDTLEATYCIKFKITYLALIRI